jgi:hypothetical protein
MKHYAMLSLIARIHPAVWDVIDQWGPLVRERYSAVALNPQPLPPGPQPDRFLLEAGLMAREVTRLAIEADVRGEGSWRFLSEFVDDWCATPWPRKWPWPWPGPRPDEGPQPEPEPWQVDTARVVGAVVLASYASRLGEGELSVALAEGAERLAVKALGG